MPKLLIEFVLDSNKPYEKLVFDILQAMPSPAAIRDFMVSAALHYSKSPAYLTEVKMAEFLEKTKGLEELLDGTAYNELWDKIHSLASVKEDLTSAISEAVASKVGSLLDELDLSQVGSAAPRQKKPPKAYVDLPEDVLGGMAETFSG